MNWMDPVSSERPDHMRARSPAMAGLHRLVPDMACASSCSPGYSELICNQTSAFRCFEGWPQVEAEGIHLLDPSEWMEGHCLSPVCPYFGMLGGGCIAALFNHLVSCIDGSDICNFPIRSRTSSLVAIGTTSTHPSPVSPISEPPRRRLVAFVFQPA